LLIGGAGLARGYRGDPAMTARRFVSLPPVAEGRLYRTGDQVKRQSDGSLMFLGRIDNQVKVRGFRVGLEEVEHALASHPGVRAAAVKAVADAAGEKSLAAFVVPRHETIDLAMTLSAFLRQQLPSYMVPGHYVTMAALPLTVSGKIDRARLPDPPAAEAARSARSVGELETALIALWQNLLQRSEIELDDNFFDLGGHSLLAFTMLARLRSMAIAEPTMSALFAAPTIRGLAGLVRQARRPPFSYLVPLRPGTGDPLFIVHGVFGNVLQLAPLAMRLETDRPVIALQARGVDPTLEPHCSIQAMAEAYLEAIRGIQPTGPYFLAGYSFGGLVAFEMACRLRLAGKPVGLMALLETDLHHHLLPLPHKLAYGGILAGRVIRKLCTMSPTGWLDYLGAKMLKLRRTLAPPPLEGFDWPLDDIPEDLRRRYRQMYAIGLRAFYGFAPSRFDGHLHLFVTSGPRYDTCDPRPIWRRAARSLDVIEIPGEHTTIMDAPNVPMLAARLSACLAIGADP
jgi:thioesterase domain-containing protein